MIIAVGSDGGPQDNRIFINSTDRGDQENEELDVIMGRLAGLSRLLPLSSDSDQLTCLPEPLILAKVFHEAEPRDDAFWPRI